MLCLESKKPFVFVERRCDGALVLNSGGIMANINGFELMVSLKISQKINGTNR